MGCGFQKPNPVVIDKETLQKPGRQTVHGDRNYQGTITWTSAYRHKEEAYPQYGHRWIPIVTATDESFFVRINLNEA
jgi:hypothetical protein